MKTILYRAKKRQKDEEKETFRMFLLVEQHDHEGHKIWGQAGNEDKNRVIQDLRGKDRNTKLDERQWQ